jgi:hypothetical protein
MTTNKENNMTETQEQALATLVEWRDALHQRVMSEADRESGDSPVVRVRRDQERDGQGGNSLRAGVLCTGIVTCPVRGVR